MDKEFTRMDEEKQENSRETNSKIDNNKSLAMTTTSSQSLPLLMVSTFICGSLSVKNFPALITQKRMPKGTNVCVFFFLLSLLCVWLISNLKFRYTQFYLSKCSWNFHDCPIAKLFFVENIYKCTQSSIHF